MCVCVCVCVCVCCMCVCGVHVFVFVCVCVCGCVGVHVYTCMYVRTCMCAFTYAILSHWWFSVALFACVTLCAFYVCCTCRRCWSTTTFSLHCSLVQWRSYCAPTSPTGMRLCVTHAYTCTHVRTYVCAVSTVHMYMLLNKCIH